MAGLAREAGAGGPRGLDFALRALLLAWLVLGLFPAAVWAATETFSDDPGSPLDDAGTNPATINPLVYTYRDGSRTLISNILWAGDAGRGGGTNAGLITANDGSLYGRELTITRNGGGAFNFQGIDLANYSGSLSVTFQGYNGATPIYNSGPVTISALADQWRTYAPASAWTGVTEVRITASTDVTFDPFIDNVVYDLSTATTNAATSVTATTATLNGTVNPAGDSATVTFDYGTTTGYGSSATATQSPVSGSSDTAVSAALTGLACGTTYHYRVSAAGSITVNGADATFSTTACNTVPTFIGGTTTLNVLQNASATDVKSLLHASDSDSSQTLTWTQNAAPSHGTLVISSATASSGGTDITPGGTITYTPASGYTGADSFAVRVSDGTDASTRTITVAVKSPQTITFGNPGAQNFGTTPTLSATASSGLTVSFTSATTGVCTVTTGGALTFVTTGTCTINADQAGDGTYAAAPQVSQSFAVNAVVPGAPTIGTGIAGDQQVSVAFTAPAFTGGAAITGYTATSSPGGKTGTGATSPITVTGLTNGTAYTFTVTAANSVGTGAASAASASVTPKAGQSITFANPGTQVFGTSPTLTATATSGLAVSFSSSTTGVCTITGAGALTFVNTGTCTINADQAGDSAYLAATTVTRSFTVSGPTVSLSPTSLSSATISTAYSQTLTASGSTSPYTFAVTSGSLPAGLSLSSAGVLSGTPTAEGSFSFTVTATDSSASHFTGSQSYTLAVNAQTPVAGAVSATVTYNSAANAIALNITGGTATSVAVASAASHGAATASGTSITYTPASGYCGTDSFTYTATNSGGTSAAATVSITVTSQAPVAGAVSVTVLAGSTNNVIPLSITGGAAASAAVASAASHGTATASGARITYTPTTDYTGADSFTYTVTNSGGTSPAATVSITVQARINPAKDSAVQGVLDSQASTANRFAKAQISNFQTHLESLHARPQAPDQSGQGAGKGTLSRVKSAGKRTATTAPGLTAGAAGQGGDATAASGSSMAAATDTGGLLGKWDLTSILLTMAKNAKSGSNVWPWKSLNLDSKSEDPMGIGMSVWTGGTITIGHSHDSDARFTTSGVSMGTDFRVNDALVLGIGVGYGHEHETIGDDGTENNGDSYGVMLYGSLQPLDGFFLDGLVGVNRLDFDVQRYSPGAGGYAQSQRKGTQWIGSVGGGYEFKTASVLLSPYVRLDLASTHLDRSAESGAGTYDLVYFKQDISSTKAALGLRSSYLYERESFSAKPFVRIEYQRDFSNSGVAAMAYADQVSTGANYQYSLGVTDKNSLVLGGGADMQFFEDWQLAFEYRNTSGSDTRMQTFSALLRRYFTF
ncbi:MAG: hypothetical protein AUJ49_07800 [Desulfovibrionaceae bacterium CG1_02_65_16]|nr:MAG: hypothetical protein AUJ49_07800 [Desulfovibrionaceae bacterium CG1_02_65_16]